MRACLSKWSFAIIDAIGDGTLEPRRPDAWPKIQSDSTITAEWLLPWEELARWAHEIHGVSIGELPELEEAPGTTRGAPEADTTEANTSEAETRTNDGVWPYTHDTKLLAAVRWVIETYWEGKDESMWPTREFIYEKIRAIYPGGNEFSDNELKAIDLVSRHDMRRNRAIK